MCGVRSQNWIHITSLCECGIREKEHAGKCDMLSFHGGCRNVKKILKYFYVSRDVIKNLQMLYHNSIQLAVCSLFTKTKSD